MPHLQGKTGAISIIGDEFADVTRRNADALFISGDETAVHPDAALWIQRALWMSTDYEPTTHKNWREDIEWSGDSTVVAVIIEDEYVFACDFTSETGIQASENIRKLLEERDIQN